MESFLLTKKIVKGRLTKITNSVATVKKSPKDAINLLDLLEKSWNELEENFRELVKSCDDEQFSLYQIDHDASLDKYLSTKGELQMIAKRSPSSVASDSNTSESRGPECRLPKLILPTFSGKMEDWLAFKCGFMAAIVNKENLSGSDKLQYLIGQVSGEAKKLLQHLPLTDDNFDIAWKTLFDQYEHTRELVFAHLRKMVNFQPCTSEKQLQHMLNTFKESISQLDNLGQQADNNFVVYLFFSKLDPVTFRDYNQTLNVEIPDWGDVVQFMSNRCRAIAVTPSVTNIVYTPSQPIQAKPIDNQKPANFKKMLQCVQCKNNHYLNQCEQFKKLSHEQKREFIKTKRRCFNCLKPNCSVSTCKSTGCLNCGKKHHTLLHFDKVPEPVLSCVTQQRCLLGTAKVLIKHNMGWSILRAIIDPGATASFISKHAAERLKLKTEKISTRFVTISGTKTPEFNDLVDVKLKSLVSPVELQLKAVVLPQVITPQPTTSFKTLWTHLENLELADPEFHITSEIDLLLSCDVFTQIIEKDIVRGNPGCPVAVKTRLGYIVMGPYSLPSTSSDEACLLVSTMGQDIQSLWNQDQGGDVMEKNLTAEEEFCEKQYKETTERTENGNFIVKLPMNVDKLSNLSDTKKLAVSRLIALEKKFIQLPRMAEEYRIQMQEYLDQKLLIKTDQDVSTKRAYYLPHHAVYKESSATTKLRIVFDGSASTKDAQSLNSLMFNGPKVQDNLFNILCRWRTFPIAMVTDISRMYLQVHIDKEQHDLQRIVWRKSTTDPIETFQLTRLTFGIKAAPYLATKTLNTLADTYENEFYEASYVVKNCFYIDDGMFGAHSVASAIKLKHDVTTLLQRGGFTPQKWASNDSRVFSSFDASKPFSIADPNNLSTLGLQWDSDKDDFFFKLQASLPSKVTKRTILSQAAKLFDPLNWLAPITIQPKIFLQKLWKLKLSWDEILKGPLLDEWLSYTTAMKDLQQIRIPRFLGSYENAEYSLWGFADASEKAYCATVFLRTVGENFIQCHLVSTKVRVAPLKSVSLPRLELCAAVLLCRLMNSVESSLHLKISYKHYFSDSTIVLSWVAEPSYNWHTYVSNRIAEIHESTTSSQWHHVRTYENPADRGTRGSTPSQLACDDLWWHGPKWLRERAPLQDLPIPMLQVPLERRVILLAAEPPMFRLDQFETEEEMCRVIIQARRFLNVKTAPHPRSITAAEYDMTLLLIIKKAQQFYLATEIKYIKQQRKSSLSCLNPFFDDNNILRVNGRLINADLSYNERYPIILPPKSRILMLIVRQAHKALCHAGAQLTLAHLRKRYWIIQGKRTVKAVIHKCVRCTKVAARLQQQMMAPLPAARARPSRPFSHSGVDYAGPVLIRPIVRSKIIMKAYICVFVCFSTRAVHLEAVSDLTTEAFLAALRRFLSRRGKCVEIHSDNGMNFQGAANELKELYEFLKENENIWTEELAVQQIKWSFNPPLAPHHGGIWEAAVKSTKFHLRRVMGLARFTFEELTTVLTQIEACLNSRPLCPLTDDVNDINPLTPGHFLVGDSLMAMPDVDLCDVQLNRLNRWQLVQRATQEFWRRWKSEYLTRLQSRPKWLFKQESLKEGDLVILKEENTPPLTWKLARVKKLHPAADGITRVVTVGTSNKEFQRPVQALVKLPYEEEV